MFRSYITTAWRNIVKDKFYSLINVGGLALGLTITVFILLYIIDELSYDTVYTKHKRIYRLESFAVINNKEDRFAITQLPMGPTLKDEYPEIEEFVRFLPSNVLGTMFLSYNDREFEEDSIMVTDSTVFRVFDHRFIEGDPERALTRPNTMVMTQSMARKYFGTEPALGKILTPLDGKPIEVTGVIEDLPGNVHLKFQALLSAATLIDQIGADRFNDRSAGSFWNLNVYTYLLLKEGASVDDILSKFPAFYEKYMKSLGDLISATYTLMAKPLARVHHHSSDLEGDQPGGNIRYIYVFSLVAILILIIASINYMNLATARSEKRSKESGLRKIAGAKRSTLVGQFLAESVVIALLSLVIALILIKLFLPYFNTLANKSLSFSIFGNPLLLAGIVILAVVVGLASGTYPAFYLSAFEPAKVIKGQTNLQGGNGFLRKLLVVFQFTISVAMIVGTFIISSQFRYLRTTDLGFDKDNLLVMEMRDTTFKKNLEPFRKELLTNPDIKGVSYSNGNPGSLISYILCRMEGDSGTMVDRAVYVYMVDYDYPDVMGMELVEGRYYDRNMKSDMQKAFVINETAARKFGWVDTTSLNRNNYASALGRRFQFGINVDGPPARDGEIIGIIRDYHFASLHNVIGPLVLILNDVDQAMSFANIRISGQNRQKTIEFINLTRKKFNDIYPFRYEFMDETLGEYYRAEERIAMLARTFTVLTVIIAALGLFGLSSFLTQVRTREIGIRKVMGASADNIVILFMKEFSIWVIIANIIAAPVTLYLLNRWLQSFPYKTAIHWWIFLMGLALSLVIAMVTVSLRVIRSASINPAEAIRYT